MPSLRTLLDAPDIQTLGLDVGTAPSWQRNNVLTQFFQSSYGLCRYDNCLVNNCWGSFCICNSMDIITIELWGGGGGGAGSCCCAWGPPGGAGAYTKLTIDNNSNNYSGCMCMCVASASCCSPDRSCGYRGCKTYVNGSGICGVCAEGGRPGCSLCNFFGCFPNNGCGVLEHPNADDCACFYGCGTRNPDGSTVCADGIPGRHGWLQTDCCSPSDFCWYKVAFPIPGGLGTNQVSYKIVRASCNNGTANDQCFVGGWANDNAHAGTDGISRPVGTGGNTARVCGGGCCCGWPGGPGLIKISWT
jgi:hypothetical protein